MSRGQPHGLSDGAVLAVIGCAAAACGVVWLWGGVAGSLFGGGVVGGLGWSPLGSDYSRYIPAGASKRAIVGSAALGGMIPSAVLAVIGAAVASITSSASDVVAGFPKALPGWFAVPFLIFAIIELFAINTVDLYSSGLSLQAMGIKIKRWVAVAIDMTICVIVLFPVVYSSQFNRIFTDFLLLTIVWIAPFVGIYLVDWLLRQGEYDSTALLQSRGGLYWRNGGFRAAAVIAQLVGMFAAAMWVNTAAYVGPLSSRTKGSDLSWLIGLVVGGGLYFVLARQEVRREADQVRAGKTPLTAQSARPAQPGSLGGS